MRSQSRRTSDLLECMSSAWANVFGDVKTLTLDGEIGMRGKEVDD